MTKSIRIRGYIDMMVNARRVSRRTAMGSCTINQALLLQLLETLDDLTGIDTSVPNKITVKVPR